MRKFLKSNRRDAIPDDEIMKIDEILLSEDTEKNV